MEAVQAQGPWDSAVLKMHGWCQRAITVPAGCTNAALLNIVLEDQGEVGVVIESISGDGSKAELSLAGAKPGDRVTHVNQLRVRTRDDLLATIDKELGDGSSGKAVVLTVIRLDDEEDGTEKAVAASTPPSPESTAASSGGVAAAEKQKDGSADNDDNDDADSTATAEDDKGAAAGATNSGDATLLDETRVEEEESGFFDAPTEEEAQEKAEGGEPRGSVPNAPSVVAPASPAMGGPPVGGAALSPSNLDNNDEAGAPGTNEEEGGKDDLVSAPVEPEGKKATNIEVTPSEAQAPSTPGAENDTAVNAGEPSPGVAPPPAPGGADLLAYYGVERRPTEDDEDDDEDDLSTTGGGLGGSEGGKNPLLDASDATIDSSMVMASEENTSHPGNGNDGSGGSSSSSRVCLACTFVIASPNAMNCEMCGAALPPVDDKASHNQLQDGTSSSSSAAPPLVAGAFSDADTALFESSSTRPPSSAAHAPDSPSINWDDPDDLSGSATATTAVGAAAAAVADANLLDASANGDNDAASGSATSNRSSSSSNSRSSSGAAMMTTPERPRRAPGQHQPYVDTYDGPPETPEEKASRVKKERASAAEARMTARKKAYQDALYAEIPATTTPLGMKPPLLLPTEGGDGDGNGGGGSVQGSSSGSSSGGEPSYEEEALTQHLQQLIPVMNKLQDVFVKLESARSLHQVASDRDSSSRRKQSGRSRRRQRPQGGGGGDYDCNDDYGHGDGDGGEGGAAGAACNNNNKTATSGLDLPQIVMLGAQSSGKSSVVEALVGREFLPRGTGIVTRRPLIIQMVYTPGEVEWAEFLHLPGKKFGDYHAVRAEISRATDELCGRNKAVAPQPISLRIFSPTVTNLTLVDLPGMTKVAVGDQPLDIEAKIRALALRFISNPRALVLAVLPATEDVANSEALKLASEVDPARKRTIGVLTKVDLMDDGTDCLGVLTNRLLPLKQGYVAVVNRGEKANQEGMSVQGAAARERAFFVQHPKYRLHMHRCTTAKLASILNAALVRHIHSSLPDLKQAVSDEIYRVERQLDALGDPVDQLPVHRRGKLLLSLITDYAALLSGTVNGTPSAALAASSSTSHVMSSNSSSSEMSGSSSSGYTWRDGQYHRTGNNNSGSSSTSRDYSSYSSSSSSASSGEELRGGARVSYILDTLFGTTIRSVDPFDTTADRDICMAISNANGHQQSLFVPEQCFHGLVKRQIARLERPALETVEAIGAEMNRMAADCADMSSLHRFPALHGKVLDAVQELIESGRAQGKSMVTSLVQVQLAWLNTSHPNFVGGSRAVLQAMTRLQEEKQKERDRQALLRARTLGVFGRGEVESVLEGDAQGYGSLAHHNKPKKKGWFWNKDRKEHHGDENGGGSSNGGGGSASGGGGDDGHDGRGGGDDGDDDDDDDDDFSDEDDNDDYDDSPEGEALRMRHATARRHRSDRRRAKAAAAADAQRQQSSSSSSLASQGGRGYGRGGSGIGNASINNPNGGWRVADTTAVNLESMPARVVRDYAIKSEKETIEVETVKKLVASYFNVVRKQLIDQVPKTVMAYLVKGVLQDLQTELVSRLYTDGSVDELTAEDADTQEVRQQLHASHAAFRDALKVLNDVSVI